MHEFASVYDDLVAEWQMDAGPRLAIIHARRVTAVALRLAPPIELKQVVCIDGQNVRQLDGTRADSQVHELLDVDLAR